MSSSSVVDTVKWKNALSTPGIKHRFSGCPKYRLVGTSTELFRAFSAYTALSEQWFPLPSPTTVHILAVGTLTHVNPYRIIDGLHPPHVQRVADPPTLRALLCAKARGLTVIAYGAKPAA